MQRQAVCNVAVISRTDPNKGILAGSSLRPTWANASVSCCVVPWLAAALNACAVERAYSSVAPRATACVCAAAITLAVAAGSFAAAAAVASATAWVSPACIAWAMDAPAAAAESPPLPDACTMASAAAVVSDDLNAVRASWLGSTVAMGVAGASTAPAHAHGGHRDCVRRLRHHSFQSAL